MGSYKHDAEPDANVQNMSAHFIKHATNKTQLALLVKLFTLFGVFQNGTPTVATFKQPNQNTHKHISKHKRKVPRRRLELRHIKDFICC